MTRISVWREFLLLLLLGASLLSFLKGYSFDLRLDQELITMTA